MPSLLSLARWSVLACSLAASAAGAQEAAITKRATELRDQPNAGRSTPLPAQTVLTRLPERQGAYVRVKTESGTTGWVHLFDLGPASGSATAAAGTDSGGTGLLRAVQGLVPRTNTATGYSGIRGLSAEDLAKASPNPAAVNEMEGLRASEQDARSFARSAALAAVNVPALPSPRPAGGGSNSTTSP